MPNVRTPLESVTAAAAVMTAPVNGSRPTTVTADPRRPRFRSIVAAAQVMTAPNASTASALTKAKDWQTEAWRYYDEVGEFRFGCEWLSNGLSRVNLLPARTPASSGDEPQPINLPDPDDPDDETPQPTAVEERAMELLELFAGGAIGQGQLLAAVATQLTVAGLGWLVCEPDPDDPESDEYVTHDILSVEELRSAPGSDPSAGQYQQQVGESAWRNLHPNSLVVKIWNRHPRRRWEADAPTRAILTTLKEIELLTQHIHASAVSRLAGAGLLVMPLETEFPGQQRAPVPPIDGEEVPEPDPDAAPEPTGADRFVETLVQTMTIPIGDRGNAAAIVPLVALVPGEFVDKVKFVTFSTGFDQRVLELRDSAIKRLALGLDLPPEVLTGMAGVNHWTAWQVEETAITLHIAPLAEVVCEALTTGYLKTALESEGFSPEDIASVMVWYDVTDLTTRPDRSTQATEAYDRVELGSAAYLRELGFSPDDRPDEEEERKRWLLKAAQGAPTNAPTFLKALGFLSDADMPPAAGGSNPGGNPAPPPPAPERPADGPPEQPDAPPDEGDREAAALHRAAIVAACDGVVVRALERSGARLRSAVGRGTPGGAETVADIPVDRLHLSYDPTIFADLDHLLEGAFDRVPVVAERYGLAPEALTATLKAYCRALLAAQQEHTYDRLDAAL